MNKIMEIKVSVIVPVYNVEQYIERCMNSLLNQSLKEIEIILVDDGSPDGCPQICEEYAEKYENVIVIHKKNAGLGLARNTGLEVAKGEYVAFVDSDDYVETQMYEKLYDIAKENEADIVISGGYFSEGSYKNTQITRDTGEEKVFVAEEARLLSLKMTGALPDYPLDYEYAMCVWKGIYNRKLISTHGICFVSERELISEDLIFHYDIFEYANKVVVTPECFYHYCLNDSSLTKAYQKERFYRNVDFYKYITDLLDKRSFPHNSKLYADRLLLARARVTINQIVNHYEFMNKNVKQEVLDICNHEVLIEVLKDYPICKLPVKQRIFTYMMKLRLWVGMYILIKMNNLAK